MLNADRWLYNCILSDPSLSIMLNGRVFLDVAPLGTSYPLVVLSLVSSEQISNLSAERIADDQVWQVAIWTDGNSYHPIEQIADRIRHILHRAHGDGVIAAVFLRQSRVADPEGYRAIILEFRIYLE